MGGQWSLIPGDAQRSLLHPEIENPYEDIIFTRETFSYKEIDVHIRVWNGHTSCAATVVLLTFGFWFDQSLIAIVIT